MINRKVKRVFASLLAAGMLFGCVPASAESETGNDMEMMQGGFGGGHGPMGQRNGNMGGQAQTDPALQAVIDESASKFEQFTYTDEKTGITLEYSLYIPEGYEEGTDTLYPMVMFIPDSTGAGLSSSQIVEGYYGAAVWASNEDQEKHPSFVLVPAYTGTVTDDNWNASDQLDATVNLITYLRRITA